MSRLQEQLSKALAGGAPLIYVYSPEEERIMRALSEEAAALGRPVEMDKKAAAPIQRRQGQLFTIAGQILIIQLLRVVIGQKGTGMGQAHALRLRLPAQEEGFRGLSGKFPAVVERYAPGHVFISPQSLP